MLGLLQSKTTPEERQGYIDWLYHCQVPSGGFRGFSGTDFGEKRRTTDNEAWDAANIAATFFALVNLLILGDGLSRVKRRECLQWLPKLQRADGSFGEVLGPNGSIEGDRDLRYCCCATGIRYILRGETGNGVQDVDDIDVSKLIAFIEACQVRMRCLSICDRSLVTTVLIRPTTAAWPNHPFAKRMVCHRFISSVYQFPNEAIKVVTHIAQLDL